MYVGKDLIRLHT